MTVDECIATYSKVADAISQEKPSCFVFGEGAKSTHIFILGDLSHLAKSSRKSYEERNP